MDVERSIGARNTKSTAMAGIGRIHFKRYLKNGLMCLGGGDCGAGLGDSGYIPIVTAFYSDAFGHEVRDALQAGERPRRIGMARRS
jgi:hypothetical protein